MPYAIVVHLLSRSERSFHYVLADFRRVRSSFCGCLLMLIEIVLLLIAIRRIEVKLTGRRNTIKLSFLKLGNRDRTENVFQSIFLDHHVPTNDTICLCLGETPPVRLPASHYHLLAPPKPSAKPFRMNHL